MRNALKKPGGGRDAAGNSTGPCPLPKPLFHQKGPKRNSQEIKGAEFESKVLNSKTPVLVAFMAPWSRPCQVFEATLDAVAAACEPSVGVFRINADDHPEISLWYDIQAIPTVLMFAAGRVRKRIVGTATPEAILHNLKSIAETDERQP